MIALKVLTLFLFFLTNSSLSILTPSPTSLLVNDYIQTITQFDAPIPQRKQYGMQESAIDFYPGNINIIFSVPHDGDLKSNLPKRPKVGCKKVNSTNKKCYYQNPCLPPKYTSDWKNCQISHGRDRNTRLLALALRYEFYQHFQLKPFVIINRLERSKVDMNRFIDEGTFGTKDTMQAWMRYHFYLKHAREVITKHPINFARKGLLLDFHSQDHPERWTEFGYLITSRQLANENYQLKTSSFASYFSTFLLPRDLISGNKSLGYFLSKYQYSATPSPLHPSPPSQSYFDWGYTIEEQGRYENFSAIMIESPLDELTNQTKFYRYAKSLAAALQEYLIEIELLEPLIPLRILEISQSKQRCNDGYQWFSDKYILFIILCIHFV